MDIPRSFRLLTSVLVNIAIIGTVIISHPAEASTEFLLLAEKKISEGKGLTYLPHLKKIVESTPEKKSDKYAMALFLIGRIYDQGEVKGKALSYYQQAIMYAISDDLKDRIFMSMAAIFAKKKEYLNALSVIKKIKNPEHGDVGSAAVVAKMLINLNRLREAQTLISAIREKEPSDEKVLFLSGAVEAGLGNYEEAISYFQKVRMTSSSKYISDLATLQMARCMNDLERYSDAISLYSAVNSPFLRDVAQVETGWMYYKLNEYSKAINIIDTISKSSLSSDALLDANILRGYIISENEGIQAGWKYLKGLMEEYQRQITLFAVAMEEMETWKYPTASAVIQKVFPLKERIFENILADTPSIKEFESTLKKIRDMYQTLTTLLNAIITLEDRLDTIAHQNIMEKVKFVDSLRERLLELKLAPVIEKVNYKERNTYEQLRNYRRELLNEDRELQELIRKIYSKLAHLEKELAGPESEKLLNKYNIYAGIAHRAVKASSSLRELLDYSLERLDYLVSIYSIKYNIENDPRIKTINRLLKETEDLKRELYSIFKSFNINVILKAEKLKDKLKSLQNDTRVVLRDLNAKRKYYHYMGLSELREKIINQLAQVELAYSEISWRKKMAISSQIDKIYSTIDKKQTQEESVFNQFIYKTERVKTSVVEAEKDIHSDIFTGIDMLNSNINKAIQIINKARQRK